MKTQTLLLLIVAGGCGLVATLGVKHVMNKNGEDASRRIQVLQAATDIKIGDPLNELNTQFVTVTPESSPEGAVTDLVQIAERSLKLPASAGDWITVKKLSEPGEYGAVTIIPEGMQVCTIPVDATTSHSGMLKAGNRVDLILSYDDINDFGKKVKKVKRLLQYIEVFAVDDKTYGITAADGESHKANNVSLLVNPDQGMHLEMARSKGKLSTLLRGNGDSGEIVNDDMTEHDLNGSGPGVDTRSTIDTKLADSKEPTNNWTDLHVDPLVVEEPVPENIWTIAIWEGSDVRLEEVNLDSDLPLPTQQTEPFSPAPTGEAKMLNLDELMNSEEPSEGVTAPMDEGEPVSSGALEGLMDQASGWLNGI